MAQGNQISILSFYFHFHIKMHDQISQVGQRLLSLTMVDLMRNNLYCKDSLSPFFKNSVLTEPPEEIYRI